MKKPIAVLVLMSFLGLLWAQSIIVTGPDTTKTPMDTTQKATIDNTADEVEPEEEVFEKGYGNGFMQGQIVGSQKSQTEWLTYSCGGGLLFGCIGAGGVWMMANGSGDLPDSIPAGNAEFQAGYTNGYLQATKSKKSSSAIMGGIAGSLASVAVTYLLIVIAMHIYQ